MTTRKFEFKKSYEEIDIAGKIFKVSLKDSDRKEYNKQIKKFFDLTTEIDALDLKTLDINKGIEIEDNFTKVTLETLGVIFNEENAIEIYKMAGEQTDELIPIIFSVAEIINERRQSKVEKYSKKRK